MLLRIIMRWMNSFKFINSRSGWGIRVNFRYDSTKEISPFPVSLMTFNPFSVLRFNSSREFPRSACMANKVSLNEVTGAIEFMISCDNTRIKRIHESISFSSSSFSISFITSRVIGLSRNRIRDALTNNCTVSRSFVNVTLRLSPGLISATNCFNTGDTRSSWLTWVKTSKPSNFKATWLFCVTNPRSSNATIPELTLLMINS